MLVCFDKNGVLKEQLDSYGNLPRVGSQLFKIFAYFKDVDLTNYGAAYIKLQRPDLSDSEYPVLFMMQVDLTYNPNVIAPSVSNYFSANGGPNDDDTYPCYLFDFSTIVDTMKTQTTDDDQIVTLLDTPGQWQATITLISTVTGASNVVGTISFNVGGAVSSEQETQIDFDIVTHNIATIIATKLESKSTYYMRSMDGFETAADDGTLPKSIFSYPNLTVWDRTEKALYLTGVLLLSQTSGILPYAFLLYFFKTALTISRDSINTSTHLGSNCVPLPSSIIDSDFSSGKAGLYTRGEETASNTSATAIIRADNGISSPCNFSG